MSANIYSKTSVAALDTRKCSYTEENTHIGAQYSREKGLASSILRRASGPLLEGDESGAVRGSDTGPTMLHRLVGDGELSQVVSDHLWLHLNLCEDLAVVNSNNGSSHLGDNDHVPEVVLDQGHWLPLESPGELPPDPADKQLHQLLVVHVE